MVHGMAGGSGMPRMRCGLPAPRTKGCSGRLRRPRNHRRDSGAAARPPQGWELLGGGFKKCQSLPGWSGRGDGIGGRQSVGGITDTARGFGIRGRDHGHGTGIVGAARGGPRTRHRDCGHGTGIVDTALGGSRTRPIPTPSAHPRPTGCSEHGVCRRAAKHTQKASHYPLISALPAPAINTRAGCCC